MEPSTVHEEIVVEVWNMFCTRAWEYQVSKEDLDYHATFLDACYNLLDFNPEYEVIGFIQSIDYHYDHQPMLDDLEARFRKWKKKNMDYCWRNPWHWFDENCGPDDFYQAFKNKVTDDDIQDAFQKEMEEDGYFIPDYESYKL